MRRAVLLVPLLLLIGCQGVTKLDLTSLGRDRWQRPADVVEMLGLRAGDRVADLGAGEGYFVPHLQEAVGTDGMVYAVDIEADAIQGLEERYPPDTTNVMALLGAPE